MALAAFAAPASAGPIYSFSCITNNSPTDCAIGEAQLSMEVIDEGGGIVSFKFTNAVGEASSITDIYFDDASLLGGSSITDSGSGVSFSGLATPPNLPGGSSISPAFVATTSTDSDPPIVANGVNTSSEWVQLSFSLLSGQDYQDVIDALGTGDLRVGLHVQGFASGGSEAFVSSSTPVPEPGTMLLLGAGLTGLATARRRRRDS